MQFPYGARDERIAVALVRVFVRGPYHPASRHKGIAMSMHITTADPVTVQLTDHIRKLEAQLRARQIMIDVWQERCTRAEQELAEAKAKANAKIEHQAEYIRTLLARIEQLKKEPTP